MIILIGIRIVVGVIVILIFRCIRIKVSRPSTICRWMLGQLWVLRMYANVIIIIIEIEFIGMSTLWYENIVQIILFRFILGEFLVRLLLRHFRRPSINGGIKGHTRFNTVILITAIIILILVEFGGFGWRKATSYPGIR